MKTKNKSFKRLFAFLVALVMVTALVPSVIFAATDLTDVEDSWAKEHIEYLLEKEVVRGFPDKTFRPEENVTRQQAAQMIAIGADLTASTGFVSKFVDVDKIDKDALVYVKALEDHKVISGFPDGSFGAVQPIKRSQAAKMIVNAFGLVKGELDVKFDDPVADAADQEYIDILASNGIVKGYTEDGKQLYKPYNLVTRAQLAKMIDLAMNLEDPTFRVVDVSAIDTTKVVTVKATAPNAEEGATANVAIFAYDEEGVRGETAVATETDVEIVEGVIEAEFDTLETGSYVAVVTVGEEEAELDFALDFKAVDAAVKAVNEATTQIQLWDALENELFEGIPVKENIVKYAEALTGEYNTVKEILDIIKGINDAGVTKELINQIKEAADQFELLALLEANFNAVDADLIGNYEAAIVEADKLEELEDVQDLIFFVNADHAVGSLIKTFDPDTFEITELEDITQADINAAQGLIDVLEDDYELVAGEITKAGLQNALDAVQNLFDANSAAAAVVELIKAIPEYEEITAENINEVKAAVDAAKEAYDELEDTEKALVTNYEDLETAEEDVNTFLEALTSINTYLRDNYDYAEAPATLEDDLEALGFDLGDDSNYQKLDRTAEGGNERKTAVFYDLKHNLPEEGYTLEELQVIFDEIVETRLVTQASADILENAETVEDFNGIEFITIQLDRFNEVSYEKHSGRDIKTDKIPALQAIVDDFNYLNEEYQTEVLEGVLGAVSRAQDGEDKLEELLPGAVLNCAIETNDVTKLQELIVENNVDAYINLPRAQRGEVVEYLIATTEEAFDTVDEFEEAVNDAILEYEALLSGVNEEEDKTVMVEKLGAIKYDAFDNLTAVQKLDVAEEILAMVTAEGDDKVEFETLAQIRAAVDAVMVELGY